MKTRKILALLLSVVMILGLVAGCGSNQPETPTTPAEPTTTPTEPVVEEEPMTLVVGYSPFNS